MELIMKRYLIYLLPLVIGISVSYVGHYAFQWLGLFLLLATPLIIIKKYFSREDLFLSPVFWFFGSMLLWSITLPLDFILGFEERLNADEVFEASKLYAIANVTAVIVFLIFQKKTNLDYKKNQNQSSGHFYIGITFIILGFVMLLYRIHTIGGIEALGVGNRLNVMQTSTSDSLSLPWQSALNVGLFLLSISTKANKLNRVSIFIIFIAIFLILGFGARGDVLFVCLPAILIVLYRKGFFYKNSKKIVVLMIILLILSPIYTIARNAVIYEKSVGDFEKWEWAYNTGETGGAFRVTAELVNHIQLANWPDDIYKRAILSFLPSFLYERIYNDGKFSSDKFFVTQYHPQRAENGASFGFSPVAESWISGGIIGVTLLFSILGLLLAIVERYRLPACFLPLLMWVHRVSFDNFISSLFFISFFLIIGLVINAIVFKKNTIQYDRTPHFKF